MKVSLAEVLKHGDGEETGLGAVDRDVAAAAVHQLHTARLRHAVIDADLSLFFLPLMQEILAWPAAARLDVEVRVRTFHLGPAVLGRLCIQRVAELA